MIHGELKKSGEGYRDATPGFGMSVKWSDGEPVHALGDTHASLWWNGVGHSYTITAAAGTDERVLRVYVGGIEGGRGKLTAHLSDASAPDYISTTWNGNRAHRLGTRAGRLHGSLLPGYQAASPGQLLQVTWTLDGEPNRFLGQARLQAVTLAMADEPHRDRCAAWRTSHQRPGGTGKAAEVSLVQAALLPSAGKINRFRRRDFCQVERKGIEPSTSALRTER